MNETITAQLRLLPAIFVYESNSGASATTAYKLFSPNQIDEHRVHFAFGQNDLNPACNDIVYAEARMDEQNNFYAQRSKWTRKLNRSKRSKHEVKPIEIGGSYIQILNNKTHWHRISNLKAGAKPIGARGANNFENNEIIRRRRDPIIRVGCHRQIWDRNLKLLSKTQSQQILHLLP